MLIGVPLWAPNRHQPEKRSSIIRRGEGGGAPWGGPLWSPAVVGLRRWLVNERPPCPPLATIKDFVGECDSEANRRKSQGRGKPCPYHDTAWQARPCHGRGAPCGYPSTQLHFLYLSPTKSKGPTPGRDKSGPYTALAPTGGFFTRKDTAGELSVLTP